MNDFFDKVFLDNTVRNYAIVAVVIFIILILKKFISRYIARLIFSIVQKIWKDIDRKSFSDLVVQPLGFFLLILATVISLHKLNFPQALDTDIYKVSTKELLHGAGSLVLIISFIWLLLRMIDFIALILERKANLTADQSDNQLIVFFKDFFKIIITIIGILMVLKYVFGLAIGNLLTGLSIATAAIALSLRESLENLIASFIIFFDRPFTLGDLVKVQQVTGTVEKIGLRSTRIRTDQKTFVTVPNKQMVDSIVDNLSLRTQRKAEIRLELGLSVSADVLAQFVAGAKQIITRPQIEGNTVFLEDIKSNAFLVHVDYFTAPVSMEEFNGLKQSINLALLRLMDELKIELAGANTDIRIIKDKTE